MDCPFKLEFEEEDDEIDPDEHEMMTNEEHKKPVVEGFALKQKKPLISKFDLKNQEENEKNLRDQYIKETTIDDDAPDLEEYDELEQTKQRLH